MPEVGKGVGQVERQRRVDRVPDEQQPEQPRQRSEQPAYRRLVRANPVARPQLPEKDGRRDQQRQRQNTGQLEGPDREGVPARRWRVDLPLGRARLFYNSDGGDEGARVDSGGGRVI